MRVSCFHYVHEKHISKCAFICVPEKKNPYDDFL